MQHEPVLLEEMLTYLEPQDDCLYVDATFGNGGYSKKILDSSKCNLVAFDRDPNVKARAEEFKEIYAERFNFIDSNFSDISEKLAALNIKKIDGIVFDLGVSSMQLDQAERGFSFQNDAVLDMRMSQEGISAKDVVNDMSETEIADIIYQYGDERQSRRIAREIIKFREDQEIVTTKQLANIIHKAKFFEAGKKIDPATKTFQALRIFVNDELSAIQKALNSLLDVLAHNAKLVVVSFHSLEDRIIKNYLQKYNNKEKSVSRYLPDVNSKSKEKFFKVITKKPVIASQDELSKNPRSRSAKLRAASWVIEAENE